MFDIPAEGTGRHWLTSLAGARILKSGLAVGLAWAAGQALGQPYPIFAAMAALSAVKPTIASSLRHTLGQVVGMALGTGLAVVGAATLNTEHPAAVGLGVVLALLATIRLGAHALFGTEVAVTTLLVFAIAHGEPAYGILRIWEAALGGAIAVVINALVLPPDYRDELRTALGQLALDLEDRIRSAVDNLLRPATTAEAWSGLLAARSSVRRAESLIATAARAREAARYSPMLRFSPLRRGAIEQMEHYAHGVDTLAGALDHARTAARIAWHASHRPGTPVESAADWSEAVNAVADAIRAFEVYIGSPSRRTRGAAEAAVDHAAKLVSQLVATTSEVADVDRAALLGEVEHVLVDLSVALQRDRGRVEVEDAPPALGLRLARTNPRR